MIHQRKLYFIDTEFYEDAETIDLLSIGIACDDGRELYACNLDANIGRAARDEWLRTNVLPQLAPWADPAWMRHTAIRDAVRSFVSDHDSTKPEFWCWYGASDWVLFYRLFGKLIELPKGWPKWFHELKQIAGDNALPPKPQGTHSAIVDARWNREVHKHLTIHT